MGGSGFAEIRSAKCQIFTSTYCVCMHAVTAKTTSLFRGIDRRMYVDAIPRGQGCAGGSDPCRYLYSVFIRVLYPRGIVDENEIAGQISTDFVRGRSGAHDYACVSFIFFG